MANFFKEYHKQRKTIIEAEEARQTIEKIKRQEAEEAERNSRIKLLKEAVKNWYYEFNNSDNEKEKEYAKANMMQCAAEIKVLLVNSKF